MMRTRTLQHLPSGSPVHVMSLEESTGCRVHIERGGYEVRLFGPKASVAEVSAAIERLQTLCVEAFVSAEGAPILSTSALEALGHQCGATLTAVDGGILVLGLQAAVASTVKELELCLTGDNNTHEGFLGDSGERREYSSAKVVASHAAATAVNGVPDAAQHLENQAEGTLTLSLPKASESSSSAHKDAPNIKQSSLHHVPHRHRNTDATCPTCGVGPFCGSCGFMLIPQPIHMMAMHAETPSAGVRAIAPVAFGEPKVWQQQLQQLHHPQPQPQPHLQQQQPWQQQQQQQQQQMAQFCIPFGGMMAVPEGMAHQQCQPGAANMSMVEGQAYMVPMWMPQQCMASPYDQSASPNHGSPKYPIDNAHMTTTFGSLPSVDCPSSVDSLEVQSGAEPSWLL
jgi:hypothetical protein